jgi:hypothetical protein
MPERKTEIPEKRVKVGFTLKRKQTVLLRILAKNLGVTQGDVVGYLLDITKHDVRNMVPRLRKEAEKDRESEEGLINKVEKL